MVDLHSSVCCMCGDVGFSEKIFRCSKCCYRFQHEYCSNFYSKDAEAIEMGDWCRCKDKKLGSSSEAGNNEVRSAGKIKHQEGGTSATGKILSPQPTARRYKLLKDV